MTFDIDFPKNNNEQAHDQDYDFPDISYKKIFKKIFSKEGLIIATLFVWLTLGLFGYFVLQVLREETEDLQIRLGNLEQNVQNFYTQVSVGDLPVERTGENEFRKAIPYLLQEVSRLNLLHPTSTNK